MAANIGFTLLLMVLFSGIFLPIFNYRFFYKTSIKQLQQISFAISILAFTCALISQLCLIYSFIISDYSILNVYNNSHHLKPLIYKISGSWGNHEGSMLLLITIICGYNVIFNYYSKINLEQKIIITSCQILIAGLFAAFTAFTSNPFTTIFPIPNSGLGLNPLLQDIGLALHPPMLYTGYLGFSLIFSFAIAGLLTLKIDRNFAYFLKPWAFFSWSFLTLGIALGSWWAYRELGWGGYWFWDPVENVSLLPWLCATALLHCLKLLERKEIFKSWTIFLSILTFICCLLGIFLVRSGVLTSVHSFAVDAKRGFFIIFLIALIGGSALFIYGNRINKVRKEKNTTEFFSKINAILFNNYFLMLALFIILLGTIYPIFLRSFFNEFITIGAGYYNQVFSILIIPFLIFLCVSNDFNFEKHSNLKNFINRRNILILLASIIIASLSFLFSQPIKIFAFIALTFAIYATISTFFISKNPIMKMAHCGFCLMIVGIILTSSFSLTKEVNIKPEETTKIGPYKIEFTAVEYFAGKNFLTRQGVFMLFENGQKLGELTPQLRYYPVSDQTTNEASIAHGIFGDIYIVIGNKDDQENYAIRIYYKPFIYLIWLGCGMMFLAGIGAIRL